jgi:AcrR family transcriptional regulator
MQGPTEVASKSRPRPSRDPLSRERIARAALELADSEGIDAFSMRRLAAALGAGTMTLYGHFGDKQELLNAVVAVAVADQPLPEFSGTWREQAHQLAAYLRQTFARHPCVVEIWARQPVVGAGALRGPEAGMRILDDAGFEPEEAAKSFRLLITYIFGFALFSAPRSGPRAQERTRQALASLSPETHPHLSEAAGPFSQAMASDDAFSYGLDRILDGLELRLGAD